MTYRKEYMKKYNEKKIEIRRNFILKYKSERSCEICNWNDHTEILQFHHKELTKKKFQIGVSSYGIPLEKIKKEMIKCILLCPNCHNWIHYKGRFQINRERKV